ncbi:MAG TPA: hypothetical protein VE553_02345 [Candidatus Binatia bacterium]|nr:hypothetical protein [Candidatus Binatia bacterium]
MTQEAMDLSATPEPSEEPAGLLENPCSCGRAEIEFTCHRCGKELCALCTYREENGTLAYCRECANVLVGVCDICDTLHAKPCQECGMMLCEAHQTRVVERWGWGGRSGQGGVVEWFPIVRTYCQEHGQNRVDRAKPERRFTGVDGSSPEW